MDAYSWNSYNFIYLFDMISSIDPITIESDTTAIASGSDCEYAVKRVNTISIAVTLPSLVWCFIGVQITILITITLKWYDKDIETLVMQLNHNQIMNCFSFICSIFTLILKFLKRLKKMFRLSIIRNDYQCKTSRIIQEFNFFHIKLSPMFGNTEKKRYFDQDLVCI